MSSELVAVFLLAAAVADGAILTQEQLAGFLSRLEPPGERVLLFTQEHHSTLLEEPLVAEGRLEYASDGTLIKEIFSPVNERVTMDGEYFLLESPDRSLRVRTNRQPALKALLTGLRALLERDGKSLSAIFSAQLVMADDGWRLDLLPIERSLARHILRFSIEGSGSCVLSVIMFSSSGDWQEMHLRRERGEPEP